MIRSSTPSSFAAHDRVRQQWDPPRRFGEPVHWFTLGSRAFLLERDAPKVLQHQFMMSAKRQRECANDDHDQHQHAAIVPGVGAKFQVHQFWRGSGYVVAR
jgi:hypothetical protein